MGLSPGTRLSFYRNAEFQIEVIDDHYVRLVSVPDGNSQGLICDSRSRSLTDILEHLRSAYGNVSNPTRRWRLPDGRLLREVYDETYGPRH